MKVVKQLFGLGGLFLLMVIVPAKAQSPIGTPIQGNSQTVGKPGVSVSVAQQTWAIGYSYDNAPHHLGGPPGQTPEGVVRVFEWDGFQFNQKGTSIDSVLVGQFTNMSHVLVDPITLAVSRRSLQGVQVVVYDWDRTEWVQRGQPVPGATVWHMGDANTISTAEPSNPLFPPSAAIVWEWDGSSWVSKGSPINPNQQFGNFGSRLFMPHSNMVAIAANGYDGRRGEVSVFYWTGTVWHRRGLPLQGDVPGERFGSDVYMSDGNTIAIGATGSDVGGVDAGYIKVFDWNGQVWMPRGTPIYGGTLACKVGWGFSMPDDNTLVVVSDSSVQVFKYNGSDWQSVGNPIVATMPQHDIWSAALSGPYLAVGCSNADTGSVRMFDYSSFGISVSENQLPQLSLYPNPSSETLRVDVPLERSGSYFIVSSAGRIAWKGDFSGGVNTVDVSDWAAGMYYLCNPSSGTTYPLLVSH